MSKEETSIKQLLEKDGVIQQEKIEEEKLYTLRKLSSKDIKPMLKILKKFNFGRIKDAFSGIDFSEFVKKSNKDEESNEENTIMNIGKDIVFELIPMLLEAIEDCIDDVNILLADVANIEIETLENLDLDIYFDLIYDFINKKEFKGFMKVVSKFLNSEK